LEPGDFVVELGSNDGTMLRAFDDDIDVLGVEPAENIAKTARERGVPTINRFFNDETAAEIRDTEGKATAIIANNVLGHVDDLHCLLRGIDNLLTEEGVFAVEVPYLVDLYNKLEFDTVYHEHISYWAIRPLQRLLDRFDMEVFDVTRLDVHGGSIRVFIQRKTGRCRTRSIVGGLRTLEQAMGLHRTGPFDEFAEAVERKRRQLKRLVDRVRRADGRIVGYGASAKGNVLMNYCDIGTEEIEYMVDTTPAKQGTLTPGTHVPVRSPDEFERDDPDYALLTAWNYKDVILKKERNFREKGGLFIIPVPYVDVV